MDTRQVLQELQQAVGSENVLSEREELIAYECDGLTFHRLPPDFVVMPNSTAETAHIVAIAKAHRVPIVARGAGTGLSGGALPAEGGIVVETSRMKNLLESDELNRQAVVQPGMVNAEISARVADAGFFFAPDPSSQIACTLGGNVAENSGGPHCLKYGTTVNHIHAITAVLGDAAVVQLGSAAADTPGYDLCGVFVGSEGTFGIATAITLRLLRQSPAVCTLLVAFKDADPAIHTVSDIIAAGILPVALEMMDHTIIEAVEDSHYRAGYPRDAGAVLLIELDGLESALMVREQEIRDICVRNSCTEIRTARNGAERAALWAGRKGAFGACGRLSPNMYLSDTVVPRNRLPQALASVYEIARRHRIRIANVFHAGDGNLHPILLYDGKDADETQRMLAACSEIMDACLALEGCLSGEHGIGLEKRDFMNRQFEDRDLEAMTKVKRAFDPEGLCNPSKIIPQRPACGEARKMSRLPEGTWI